MEILLWLVPPVVVTAAAMLVVGWYGRSSRGEVDPEVAVRRLASALERERPRHPVRTEIPPTRRAPSTGVAVRRTEPTRRSAS